MTRILLPIVLLFWAGLLFGVSFLATPVKFTAPSLTLPVAIDIGRQTFLLLNRVEIVFGVLLLPLLWKGTQSRWIRLSGAAVVLIVLLETLWLLPAVDRRAQLVIDGATPPPSALHQVYVAADATEWLLLTLAGFGAMRRWLPGPPLGEES